MKLAILGAGAWGTAFALAQANQHGIRLWTWETDHAETMRTTRENAFLRGFPLPREFTITSDIGEALDGADLAVVATPTSALRSVLEPLGRRPVVPPVIWLCKGFESGSALFPHQVAEATLPPAVPRGALSGPSFAEEIARGLPRP